MLAHVMLGPRGAMANGVVTGGVPRVSRAAGTDKGLGTMSQRSNGRACGV